MLDSYRPNVSLTWVRNPSYFQPGLPYIDRIEAFVDEDQASRVAAFVAGKYDVGYEFPGGILRADWVQIRDTLKQRRPTLRVEEYVSNVYFHISMRTDRPPFNDVRVRQAMSLALDRKSIVDAVMEGGGVWNGPVPAAFKEWALPVDKLGEDASWYQYNPAEGRRLLADAGHPNGFAASVCFTTYGTSVIVDQMQLILKYLKDVGIDAKLDQKEYGAYASTCLVGKLESMAFGPQTPFLEPDNLLFAHYYPGEPKNQSHLNDPVVTDAIIRQRRTLDVAKRREILHDLQRYLAKQQYYVGTASGIGVAAWDAALKNYRTNLGFDYGGRLLAAWLDR